MAQGHALEQRRALRARCACWECRPNCVAHKKIALKSSDGFGGVSCLPLSGCGACTPCATSAAHVHGDHAGSSPGQTSKRFWLGKCPKAVEGRGVLQNHGAAGAELDSLVVFTATNQNGSTLLFRTPMARGVRRALIFASTVPVLFVLVPSATCAQAHTCTPANCRLVPRGPRQRLSFDSQPFT